MTRNLQVTLAISKFSLINMNKLGYDTTHAPEVNSKSPISCSYSSLTNVTHF